VHQFVRQTVLKNAGEAEIGDLGRVSDRVVEDVIGLDVSVEDALGVAIGEATDKLLEDVAGPSFVERAFPTL
jgi:hypothetical protein